MSNKKEHPTFPFHVILSRQDICNYLDLQKKLVSEVLLGQRLVFYGRRNTGKTSLIHSVVVPEFCKKHKAALVVCADFMGVQSIEDINRVLQVAFENGFSKSFPVKSTFHAMSQLVRSLRPTIDVDPMTGGLSLSVGKGSGGGSIQFERIFEEVAKIHKQTRTLIVLDEFQDIAKVPTAEGRLRASLQTLPKDLPVVALGSKKHLLSAMFGRSAAPFANWGLPIEIHPIAAKDYQKYINDRLKVVGLEISVDATEYLLELLNYIPEAINIVCYTIMTEGLFKGSLDRKSIGRGMDLTLERFRSNFLEAISRHSVAERDFLRVLARNQPVQQVQAHDFLTQLQTSSAGTRKIVKRLEDEAVIYNTEKGYELADPLMAQFLKKF